MTDADITLDFRRRERLGFDEAILCAGKNADQIERILDQTVAERQTLLLTRLSPEQLDAVPRHHRQRIDYDPLSRTGFFGEVAAPARPAGVAVVTAGTSDSSVGREAIRTLCYYGEASVAIGDVGVAGLWRLMQHVERLRSLPVVIVVAGMDAALPSVVGGLVPGAIIAVPTSTGFGVAAGGETALRAALASCAPGVVVVNIDSGFGAACAALRVLRAVR
jgi:NCAIR mutase (PurE)-related protein